MTMHHQWPLLLVTWHAFTTNSNSHGLVCNDRTKCRLTRCTAIECADTSFSAGGQGTQLEAEDCSSSQSKCAAYIAESGAKLSAMNSSSAGDAVGCKVTGGEVLTMKKVTVDGVGQSGTLA